MNLFWCKAFLKSMGRSVIVHIWHELFEDQGTLPFPLTLRCAMCIEIRGAYFSLLESSGGDGD